MKVAIVTPGFSAHEGDWCIPALRHYVSALARGADVHVFALRWPEQAGTYSVCGATVHALNGYKRMGRHALGLWQRAVLALADEHRRAPLDVIHAFWVRFILSLAGGELMGLPDIRYGLQLLPGRKWLVRLALWQADAVTVGSNYLYDLARTQCAPRKLVRIPLGVDTAFFSPAPSGESTSLAKSIVLNVGSLYPVKGQATIVRAMAQVPGAELQIVGEGPLKTELQALASGLGLAGRVKFVGAVEHSALPALYRAAHVFVQASRHEAQGMALLEAAACGVPSVGTAVGALPEIGRVARTEAEMAQRLNELLADGVGRQSAGQAARQCVEAGFSLSGAVEQFVNLYLG
jgi:glycosyltransferase involved in cell wall biosynthesis